jgi:retron-type reverse transcriptase
MTTVKQHIDMICEPFAYIINLSITTGIVPDNIKVAKVIPIFKKDNPAMFSNYRPISILSSFSKFFERIVYNRIVDFIDKKNILYMHQYGFRRHHSTHLAMSHVVENITSAFDRKEFIMGIFLDLSKAFDTVDHNILFDKLCHYGICGIAFNWVKNYFCNRKQFVHYNNCSSSLYDIVCGVPQGSILGPLFFLLYINDRCRITNI